MGFSQRSLEETMTRYIPAVGFALLAVSAQSAAAQGLDEMRKLYDSGQYQQVAAAAPSDDPRLIFLAARSQQKLGHADAARQAYEQLAARGEGDPWRDVGRSALALLASNADEAAEAANQAVSRGDSLSEAHLQRGLVLSARQDNAGASEAFEKAAQIDPAWADAHYYAGIAYSKVKRIDLMADHFNTFLKLAPQSPQRGEVQSIMRTLAGRN
jgi:tetratricopeptide (TPR) repeat protein